MGTRLSSEMISLLKEEENGSLCCPSEPLCPLRSYSCLFLSMGFLSEMQMFSRLTSAWMTAERSPHSFPAGRPAAPAAWACQTLGASRVDGRNGPHDQLVGR